MRNQGFVRPDSSGSVIRFRALIVLVVSVLGLATPCMARVLTVSPDRTGPYPTIQSALSAAGNGDTIRLLDGTFSGLGDRDLWFGSVNFTQIVIASASSHAENCILDLGGSPLGSIASYAVTFSKLTIENGGPLSARDMGAQASFSGCRILHQSILFWDESYSCIVSARDCLFQDVTNVAMLSSCSLLRCTFTDCAGCGWGTGAGRVSATDCLFQGNHGNYPLLIAGTYMLMTDVIQLRRCRFLDNAAPYCVTGTPVAVDSCVFARNTGGVLNIVASIQGYSGPSSASVQHSTLAANGGTEAILLTRPDTLYSQPLVFRMDHRIVAFGSGEAAVRCDGPIDILLSCCDLYGNSGGDWTGCIAGQSGAGGNISADPLFCGAPPDDPYILQPESPCVGGPCVLMGARPSGCYASGVVQELPQQASVSLRAWPNPMRNDVRVYLQTPGSRPEGGAGSLLHLSVFDAGGRRVRELTGPASSGLVWDGRDAEGRAQLPGVYLLRGEIGGRRATGEVVRLR